MALVSPEAWRPAGIEDLEPEAWRALRRNGSTAVVAGPGAGKTELLAQLAAYLLQTGRCPRPRRILAISFKRDAAANLAERVRRRCSSAHASRLVSMTFDAFTKSLVDRFIGALPPAWRPTRRYDVSMPGRRDVDEVLTRARLAAPASWRADIAALEESRFESNQVGAARLAVDAALPVNALDFVIQHWWAEHLRRRPRSALTFTMINRLAELLLRTRPEIRRAILATYPFVFVDEFQDTTFAQYDLLASVFKGSRTAVTVVGDPKQRIMVWAGARVDAFAEFERNFRASRVSLRLNHRSSPDLVRIQHVFARHLDPGAVKVTATPKQVIEGDVAQIWCFADERTEADHVAKWISVDLAQRNLSPRDYGLLVRQKADQFESRLGPAFAKVGLTLRNESKRVGRTTLQDVLVDELTRVVVATLRVATVGRAPSAWTAASDALLRVRAIDDEDERGARRVEAELRKFVGTLRARLNASLPHETSNDIADSVTAFLGIPAIASAYLEYATGDTLEIAIEAMKAHLASSAADAGTWAECLDVFEGVGQIPLMTVHKSKGLEYDTMLFVGLDDDTWWSHKPGDEEGASTFFVALSRAKQRAIFTFCSGRGQRVRVADLYKLLNDAGVPECEF